jgi:hypothetical protein
MNQRTETYRVSFRKMAATVSVIMSGLAFSSLVITHSDNWKFSLPIAAVCLAFNAYTQEK